MADTPLELLGRSRTVLLTTFRKNGTPVPTPVWVVRSGDELQVFSNPAAGKIKRIRNSGAVTLAPSTFRGEPLGAAVPGTARLVHGAEAAAVLTAIGRKYGLVGRLSTWSSRINARLRKLPPSVAIAITLD